jgi:hypothetical protein
MQNSNLPPKTEGKQNDNEKFKMNKNKKRYWIFDIRYMILRE